MSQCQRVFDVLKDGEPHSMRSIHAHAGFMRLNSRIAELRKVRDLFIYCWYGNGDYYYQLITLGDGAADRLGPDGAPSPSVGGGRDDPPPLGDRRSAPEQLTVWGAAA
jgi:hypothetical protein